MEKQAFSCILCGHRGGAVDTGYVPRDRRDLHIVDCPECGHRQMFPLLSAEELAEEYNEDKTVRTSVGQGGGDFEAMRVKFSEWTKIHADMYWDKLQGCGHVLNLGSGYGFLEEALLKREGRRFQIEGVEIGRYRLDHWVGGTVHNIDFMTAPVPDEMVGRYDLVMALHLMEHLNAPVEYLRRIKPLLNADGTLLVEVPNLDNYLSELSPAYKEFFYLYEHVSYYTLPTLALAFKKAGYKVKDAYTKELYSIENHINWIRNGKPFTKYNQMYLPDARLEFINEAYKRCVEQKQKGYALVVEGTVDENA